MMSSDTVCNIIAYIKSLIEEKRISSLHLDWFGGEPLLGFDKVIKPIATAAKNLSEEKKKKSTIFLRWQDIKYRIRKLV